MAIDPDFQKKLRIFLAAAILIAGGRAAYIVYERHEALKGDAEPKRETALNPDYYVNPKKLHAYDLKSAQALTAQPVWVKAGYQLTYYPYDRARHKTDFAHEADCCRLCRSWRFKMWSWRPRPRPRASSR